MQINLSARAAFILFIILVTFVFAQAVWWVVFMAQLLDEKVDLAQNLGADETFIKQLHDEEISRQIMLGMEGVVFLVVILVGIALIYRSLVKTEELKFHQQNFLMAVTHELKTPLASIKLYLDSLKSEKIPAEKKLSIVPKMKEDVYRLERLVENILEAGRFEREGYKLREETYDFSRVVRDRVERFQKVPSQVPIHATAEIEPELLVSGDSAAMGQAIDAILENSLKYHQGNEIRVDVRLRCANSRIVLEIADQGIGLDRKDLSRVFERFYRVGSEMTRRASGTGLGLYLCREIVRAHGGEISAHSDGPGKGTTFRVTLKGCDEREEDSAG